MAETPSPNAQGAPPSGQHASVDAYLAIAALLIIITVVEVGVFYVPAFKPVLVPALLTLSALKFSLVVMFYMHLKRDSRIFSLVFVFPLLLAVVVVVSLLFLFGQITR